MPLCSFYFLPLTQAFIFVTHTQVTLPTYPTTPLGQFSLYCYPRLFMFSLTPNPDQPMWLLLALVAIPTRNQ